MNVNIKSAQEALDILRTYNPHTKATVEDIMILRNCMLEGDYEPVTKTTLFRDHYTDYYRLFKILI